MATYKEKMQQANREAGASVAAAVIVAVAWAALGYGLAGSGIVVCSLPLWVVAGCGGTWLIATAASAILSHFVITDVPLDDEDEIVDEDAAEGIADDAGAAEGDGAADAPVASVDDESDVAGAPIACQPGTATPADARPDGSCQPADANPERSDSSEA